MTEQSLLTLSGPRSVILWGIATSMAIALPSSWVWGWLSGFGELKAGTSGASGYFMSVALAFIVLIAVSFSILLFQVRDSIFSNDDGRFEFEYLSKVSFRTSIIVPGASVTLILAFVPGGVGLIVVSAVIFVVILIFTVLLCGVVSKFAFEILHRVEEGKGA